MRWFMIGCAIGLGSVFASAGWTEEPGVLHPDQLQAAARNTYHSDEYGFSITKPDSWVLYEPNANVEIPNVFAITLTGTLKTGTLIGDFAFQG